MVNSEPAGAGAEIHDAHQAEVHHAAVTAADFALTAQHRAVLADATADSTHRA